MTDDKEDFLRRWSRRKKEAATEAAVDKPAETPKPNLPPVDQLTPESDYSGFMHPKVEDALRRVALKKLFRGDPHFNLPDPYEAYSGDWTVGEPISDEMMATLNQAKQLLFSEEKKEEKEEKQVQPPEEAVAEKKPEQSDEPGKQDA